MADPIAIKQIKIGTENHDIDAKYWGGRESTEFDGKLDKQIFDDNISIDKNGEFVIKDDKDNIGLKLDATGLQVKDVTSRKDGIEHVLTQKANVEYVNDYVDKKIWYGTEAQYEAAKNDGDIVYGTLVIILNDNELGGNPGAAGSNTTAKLGTAVLGQMKLGQN